MEPHEDRPPSLFTVPPVRFFVGVLFFVALLYGHRELIVFSVLILGVGTGARWWSRLSPSAVTCNLAADRARIFPGESLDVRVEVRNAKFLPVWLGVKLPPWAASSSGSRHEPERWETGLLWHQKTRFHWTFTPEKRGVYALGHVHFSVGDLFGFFPRDKETESDVEVIVYPRLVPLGPLPLPKRDVFGVPGARSPVVDPAYILGTKDYEPSRPARHIHWKASARQNRLQEKLFEPSAQEKVLLLLDVAGFARAGALQDFEDTLEVMASLAVRLDKKGCAVGAVTNGALTGAFSPVLPISRNAWHLARLLELLARIRLEATEDLAPLLSRASTGPWGTCCVHFALREGDEARLTESVLSLRKIPTLSVVSRKDPPSGSTLPPDYSRGIHLDALRRGDNGSP